MARKNTDALKKQRLTKRDIERDLLRRINKGLPLWIFLTVLVSASLAAYPALLVLLRDNPPPVIFLIPVVLLGFVWLLLERYYVDLYLIKRGKFRLEEEKLCEKKREWIAYYRHYEEENSLYFRNFRAAVEDDVFADAHEGEVFYVVILRSTRTPLAIYSKEHYEPDDGLL